MSKIHLNDIDLFKVIVDNIYGTFLDCLQGFGNNYEHIINSQKTIIEKFKKSNPELANIEYLDNTYFIYGKGDPNKQGTKQLHQTTQKYFKERNSEKGLNHILIGNYLLVCIYQFWEDSYRGKIANLLGLKKNEIKYDIFGYIKSLRISIIHNNGISLKEVENNKAFTWFNEGDPIYIDKNKFEALISEIYKVIDDLKIQLSEIESKKTLKDDAEKV